MSDIILSAAVAVLGAATILVSRTYPLGKTLEMQPGFYPKLLGVLLLFLAVLQLFRTLYDHKTCKDQRNLRLSLSKMSGPLIVFALTTGYSILLFFAGFILSTLATLLAMVRVFGGTWQQAFITSLTGTPLFYLVFRVFFDVPLPVGLLNLM